MPHYMIFRSAHGYDDIVWHPAPVGVYEADSVEEACQAAATEEGSMGTFFAVEGVPYGIALHKSNAKRLSRKAPPVDYDQLARKLLEQGHQGSGE